jgi:hypothetical protein
VLHESPRAKANVRLLGNRLPAEVVADTTTTTMKRTTSHNANRIEDPRLVGVVAVVVVVVALDMAVE